MKNEIQFAKNIRVIPQDDSQFFIHKVKQGEKLETIAKLYNQTKEVLIEVNALKKPIEVGERLYIPQKNRAIYIVKPLDTLAKIAQKYKITEEEIIALNHTNKIFIGQILLI